jgi:hypothetical protein
MRILLKKAQTRNKSNFGRHPILRFYKNHNLASKLFLFNKEILVGIFFESMSRRLKCDCWCLHFWHDCCFLESSVSLISITMSSPEERPSYKEPSSLVVRMQSDLTASFVTPSVKNNNGDGNQFVVDKLFINKRKPSRTTVAKGVLNNGEHTLIPVTVKMIHSAIWDCERFVLNNGWLLHMIELVGAVMNFCVHTDCVQINVEDGTGLVRVTLWRKKKNARHSIGWLTNVTEIIIFV